MHSPQHGHKINLFAKLSNYTSHTDMPSVYSFSTGFSFGNVSVIGDAKSIIDAFKVHESCRMGNNCISHSSNTTSKRDNYDSGWVFYTDWELTLGMIKIMKIGITIISYHLIILGRWLKKYTHIRTILGVLQSLINIVYHWVIVRKEHKIQWVLEKCIWRGRW